MKPLLVRSEQGFVLPLSVAVGAILMLLGVMMIMRASQGDRTAIASKFTSRSQAVAEAGVTHFLSFLNQNRRLALFCSTLSTGCSIIPTKSWTNITNADIPVSPNLCPGTPPSPSPTPTATPSPDPATLAQTFAQGNWQDMNANPNDGQFRLVSYTYSLDPDPITLPNPDPRGTMVVEGRVNQEANNSETYRTSKTRLEVQFQILDGPGGTNGLPGLWINDNTVADASGSTELRANVQDSTCPPGDPDRVDKLKAALARGLAARPGSTYQPTPGAPFPPLPNNPWPGAASDPGYYAIPNINGNLILPRSGDSPSGGVITYRIPAQGGKSINLSGGSTLTVTGSETIALVLEGGMTLSGGSKIQVTLGSKLIVYANDDVTLSGGSGVNAVEVDSPENAQIYVYPPATDVTLSGGSQMHLFLFAPQSQVTFSSDSNVWGNIWARSWRGSGSALIRQWDALNWPVSLPPQPRLSPITSWRRCTVTTAPDCS